MTGKNNKTELDETIINIVILSKQTKTLIHVNTQPTIEAIPFIYGSWH